VNRELRVAGPYGDAEIFYNSCWQVEGLQDCYLANTGPESKKHADLLAASEKLLIMLKVITDEADRAVLAAQNEKGHPELGILEHTIIRANNLIREVEGE